MEGAYQGSLRAPPSGWFPLLLFPSPRIAFTTRSLCMWSLRSLFASKYCCCWLGLRLGFKIWMNRVVFSEIRAWIRTQRVHFSRGRVVCGWTTTRLRRHRRRQPPAALFSDEEVRERETLCTKRFLRVEREWKWKSVNSFFLFSFKLTKVGFFGPCDSGPSI